MSQAKVREPSVGYQLFMVVLCVYALATMAIQTAAKMDPQTRGILDYADNVVCAIFFCDFLISFVRAADRKRYFFTWGWLDLLSSIPTVDAARWGRAARVMRVFRVLRGLRAAKIVAGLVLRRRAENTFLAASLVAMLLVIFCSIAVLHFEDQPDSNIKNGEDAVWWAFVTITTVGYGDRFPITSEGRFIGALLMCGGVGLFGTFSGFLAAWFIGPSTSSPPAEESDVKEELAALRAEVAGLRQDLAKPREGVG